MSLLASLIIAPRIECRSLPLFSVYCPFQPNKDLPLSPSVPTSSGVRLAPSTGPKNLALSSRGAAILPSLSYIGQGTLQIWLSWTLWITLRSHYTHAERMLNDDVEECWTFPSSTAQITIRLSDCMVINQLAIKHATTQSNPGAIPRDLVVWGLVDGDENLDQLHQSHEAHKALLSRINEFSTHMKPPSPSFKSHVFVPLAALTYSPSAKSQRFQVFKEVAKLNIDFGIVIIQVRTNWGASSTELCHIEVFGTPLGR